MSITDELREYAHDCCARVDDAIHDIADRIDAEHESACSAAYGNGVMSVPIALDESAWVELPKDADGEYIHIGDVVEWCDNGETLTVEGIGNDVLFYIDGENAEWTAARNKRHHHAPTVEDVLREFANEVYADADNEIRDRDFLCAKYAKRLTLAEVEDA